MSCLQITACHSCCINGGTKYSHFASKALCAAPALRFQSLHTLRPLKAAKSSFLCSEFLKALPQLSPQASRSHQSTLVCLFSGKGKSKGDDKSSPWKPLENVMGNLKKDPSIEDLLREQIQKQEYYDDGSSGGDPPGGGGGGPGGSGDSEEESLSGMFDEIVQVILATFGFVFLYMFIIEGEEITTFAKDIIRFIFTRQKSKRLTRLIDSWVAFFEESKLASPPDPELLALEIINTTTWWDSPEKYKRILRSYRSSGSDDEL